MKYVEAIIQAFRLDDVKRALSQIGIQGLTVTEVRGFGRQKGKPSTYRGTATEADFIPKLKLEIAVTEERLQQVQDVIANSARTGNPGDGKIYVRPLDSIVRIRTGEKGPSAV